ncbi:MAG: lysophospholipid acyltransferase family protein [Solirubrobacterales bacterium]|nr:lysophospholipid acyltransferase family protein [Solirubrobacterales bacterium]
MRAKASDINPDAAMVALSAPTQSLPTIFWRRVKSIGMEVVAFVIMTVLFPVFFVGAAAVDLTLWLRRRKPWVGVRLLAFGWWFLLGEMRGLLALFGVWVLGGGPFSKDSSTRRRRVARLQVMWAGGHLAGLRTLFGLKFEIEGDDLVEPGPMIVLVRHASLIDNTFPAALVSGPHGIALRYILKRELQSVPTLDLGVGWTPCYFVRRGSDDSAGEIERIRALTPHLGTSEGVLIWPEGTRYTPAKLARAQAKIAESDPAVSPYANRLKHLLPPRLGGPLALLDGADEADVVVLGHFGLDGFEYVSDIWRGGLVAKTIKVKFWRYPRSEIPTTKDERIAWLYSCWQALDDWIGEQKAEDSAQGPEAATLELESAP